MRIKFKNFLDTVTSFLRIDATTPRVIQFPDKDFTVAGTDDVAARVARSGDTMSGALAMGTNKITGLGDPTNPQDAVTKSYADGLSSGGAVSSWKNPVRVATIVSGTLASSFENGDTIDGVVIATDDRILIKNQSTQSENGIYIVNASGSPTRATDANVAAELHGAGVTVQEGTENKNTTWIQTTDGITLGSSSIVWQLSGTYTFARTGTAIAFATDNIYGTPTAPITGNLTANQTGAVLGAVSLVIHNHSVAPTLDSNFKFTSGVYIPSKVNIIQCTYLEANYIAYSIITVI